MSSHPSTPTTFTLSGNWRNVARAVWLVIALTVWTLTLLDIPRDVANAENAPADIQRLMIQSGLPPAFPIYFDMTVDLLFVIAFSIVAVILFLRRSDERMALWVSAMLLLTAHIYSSLGYNFGIAGLISAVLYGTGETMQVGLFYLFPSGRFLPRWSKWLIPPLVVFRILIWLNIRINHVGQQAWEVGIVVALMLIGIGFQVYRYRNQSTPVQRQQVKGVLIGLVVTVFFVATYIFAVSIGQVFGPISASNFWLLTVLGLMRQSALMIFPIMLALAIMRFRLWDIDLAINRTLVATCVTLMLIIPFAGVYFLMQRLLAILTGGSIPTVAIVVSALVTGLLFTPTRQRVQHVIDRNLYGLRFDLNELKQAQKLDEGLVPGQLTGRMLAGYQIMDVIGRGGMGEIYRARQHDRTVAVKVLPDHLASDEEVRARFLREADATADLKHPNIVKVEGSGESNGVLYMVMEYIEADDLKAFFRQNGKLTLPQTQALFAPLADALDHAHQSGYVHRDIKPGNIMVRKLTDGSLHPVLMDFGLAKMSDTRSDLTGEGAIGTIDYMAPEQIKSAGSVDARADVYALGVVLFEALAGEPPFKGSAAQVLFGHLQQPPPDLRMQAPDVPRAAAHAITRALAKLPADRYPTAGELVLALM
jgi:tRNA A-37 threonylcarbamoyl transferase component Bud32